MGDVEYLTGQTSPNHVEAVEDAVLLKVLYDRERMEGDIALYHFFAEMLLLKMEMSSKKQTAGRSTRCPSGLRATCWTWRTGTNSPVPTPKRRATSGAATAS